MLNLNRLRPRNIRRSITSKLFFTFLGIILLGTLLVPVFIGRQIFVQYFDFITNITLVEQTDQQAILNDLTTYYDSNGNSWDGIANAEIENEVILPISVVNLQDEQGNFILGDGVNRRWWQRLFNITVPLANQNGDTIGTAVIDPLGTAYVDSIRDTLLFSLAVASLVALALSRLVSRWLTVPIRQLRTATETVSRGEETMIVPTWRTEDEMGELTDAFNVMSSELTKSRELRRQMTADIAHELRSPLGLILGHAEALRDGVLPPDPATFAMLHDQAERLNRLVLDLRTLSMADAGELSLDLAPVDMADLMARVVQAYQTEGERAGVAIVFEPSGSLPTISADSGRLAQLLRNLISNALRYTPQGGRITLSAVPQNEFILMQVADTGKGIAAEDLPNVFERFYRGDKARLRTEGGSGLGLAIAKSIVEQHTGEISVASELGQGTIFSIRLPV